MNIPKAVSQYQNEKIKVHTITQNTTQKTKHRSTRPPLKTGVNSGAPESLVIPAPRGNLSGHHNAEQNTCSTCGTRRVTLVAKPIKQFHMMHCV